MGDRETELLVRIQYNENELQFSKIFLQHPLSVCLKVTNVCNFKCPHCLSQNTNLHSSKKNREMTTWEIMSVMDIIKQAGVARLNISGGEPFQRKDPIDKRSDIIDLLSHASKLCFEVSVTTNGSEVNDQHIKLMKQLRIVPDISLDGPTEELNDTLRFNGSYRMVIDLIKRLRLAEVPFILNCTIQQSNYPYFEEFVSFGKSIGCAKIYAIPMRLQGNAREMTDRQLNVEQTHELTNRIEDLKKSKCISIGLLDLRRYPNSFVLIEPNADVISQSHGEDQNLNAGNLLRNRDLNNIWQRVDFFNHTGHLLHYIRG